MSNQPSVVRMYQAMADRVRAGERPDLVLRDYGLLHDDLDCVCAACRASIFHQTSLSPRDA